MTFSSKTLEIQLKRKAGTEELIKCFGLSNADDLIEKLNQLSPSAKEIYLKRIHANDKITAKAKKKTLSKLKKNGIIPNTTADIAKPEKVLNDAKVLNTEDKKSKLDLLKEEKESLENHILDLENSLTTNNSDFAKAINEVSLIEKRIEDTKQQLKKLTDDFFFVNENITKLLDTKNSISSQLKTENDKLSKICCEIEKLTIISVFVLSNGEIQMDNEIDISNTLAKEKELFENYELIENLKVKEVKQLAKLLCLPKDRKYEFLFESDELKSAYFSICNDM